MKKIILLLGMCILLSSLVLGAKVYTFTKPPSAITDLNGTLSTGGSLTADTTYYYVVVAMGVNTIVYSATLSGISNEINITTNSTHKNVSLTWNASAGATGYAVFRYTLPDAYNTVCRIAASNYQATTTTANFTDDGSVSLRTNYVSSTVPANMIFPQGIDLRTYGRGRLRMSGGTSGDPITPKNIYDASVTDGWDDYCKWDGVTDIDGGNLVIMAHVDWDNNIESHSAFYNINLYIIGSLVTSSTHADSRHDYGSKYGWGNTYRGTHIYSLNGRADSTIADNTYFYDTKWTGTLESGSPWKVNSIIGTGLYVQMNGGSDFKDVKFNSLSYWCPRSNVPMNGMGVQGIFFPIGNFNLIENLDVQQYHLTYSDNPSRIDSSIFRRTTYHVAMQNYYDNVHVDHIDCTYPNTVDTNGLPVIYWGGAARYAGTFDLYYSYKLKVVDNDGNSIANASVIIKDVFGNITTSYTGKNVSLTTDEEGNLWVEKINITAATASTITDNSKSWANDEWQGEYIYISTGSAANQKIKIKSNTATVLTLTSEIYKVPSANDHGGIVLELKKYKQMHKAGTGAGVGEAFTTTTNYSPFTITISKDGYMTKEVVYNITKPSDEIFILEKPVFEYIEIRNDATEGLVIT